MIKNALSFLAIVAILFSNSVFSQNFVQVTKTNAGQTISLTTDQVLEINLPRKAATGYIWCESVTSADKVLPQTIARIGDDDFIANQSSGTQEGRMMVGQSGMQVLRYIGIKKGTTELKLELRRPWDKDNPAIDNFSIIITSGGKYLGNYSIKS